MGELISLLDALRKKGVVKLSLHPNGAVAEVLMGPDPALRAINAKGSAPKDTGREERRKHYAAMLGKEIDDETLDNLP